MRGAGEIIAAEGASSSNLRLGLEYLSDPVAGVPIAWQRCGTNKAARSCAGTFGVCVTCVYRRIFVTLTIFNVAWITPRRIWNNTRHVAIKLFCTVEVESL